MKADDVRERDAWHWLGLAVVGCAAAVLSFSALADLARLCGMVGVVSIADVRLYLAWLYPLSVDAFAITATVIWLRRRVTAEAVSYARWAAWSAIGTTVVGNAYHASLVGTGATVPWPVAVVVSAVPPIALGAVVHLAVLVGRPADGEPTGKTDQADREPDHADHEPTERTGEPDHDAPDPALTSAAPDDQLVADLRRVAARSGSLPGRDAIVARYRVGATRAARLRSLAERVERVERGRDEPTAQLDRSAPVGAT